MLLGHPPSILTDTGGLKWGIDWHRSHWVVQLSLTIQGGISHCHYSCLINILLSKATEAILKVILLG